MNVVFGGDPTQVTGFAFVNPGSVVALIPKPPLPPQGTFTVTFAVPNVPNGLYKVWIWEDCNQLTCNDGVQELGELATLVGDIQTFTVGAAPALSLGGAIASIYSSVTGLGFEETGNSFDNSGAGFAIAHRTLAKVVFVFTDSTRVSGSTHELLFAPDYGNAVVFGGPLANPTTAFYETGGVTPLTITLSGGNAVFKQGGTTVFTVSLASLSSTNDYFLMETFQDGGHTVVVMYGINAPGTLASGFYFDKEFATFSPGTFPASAYIVHWQGTTPNVPTSSDTFTIVFHT
jgi:hypothetical protein